MSHFTCLVIGANYEDQLAPFHEYECTGRNDQYVQDVDITEDARAEYADYTRSMMVNDETGERVDAYDDRFYRDPTPEETAKIGPLAGSGGGHGMCWTSRDWGDGLGYRTKIHYTPDGWTEQRVPISELQTFAEFVEDYYGAEAIPFGQQPKVGPVEIPRGSETRDQYPHRFGYALLDENGEVSKVIDRTNPNKEWDWYVVGGRWRGLFPLKEGAALKAEDLGEPGTGETVLGPNRTKEHLQNRKVDHIRKGDVDFERARDEAAEQANKQFDVWEECFTKHGKPRSWTEIREENENNIEKARELYHEQPCIAAWQKTDDYYPFTNPVEEYGFDREAHVQRWRNRALVPFAVVKDGKWHEKGSMGWWGIVSDERDQEEWNTEVQRLYDDLPDDTMLTLIDCHI